MRTAVVVSFLLVTTASGGWATRASGQPSGASTISVDCSTHSLQTALNSAPTHATMLVSGTCHGQFQLAKSLTIKGNPKATLNGDSHGTVLTISGAHVVHLQSLTITRGFAPKGGGINAPGGSTLMLDHVTVTGNDGYDATAPQGGGIYAAGNGVLTITDSTVSKNEAATSGADEESAEGGGIWASGSVSIVSSTFADNGVGATTSGFSASAVGGAIDVTGKLTIIGSVFSGNNVGVQGVDNADAEGGAVYVYGATGAVAISHSAFTANTVTGNATGSLSLTGGAAMMAPSGKSTVAIAATRFVGNKVTGTSSGGAVVGGAGALYVSATTLRFSGVQVSKSTATFSSFQASSVNGGGAELLGGGTIADSVLRGNQLELTSDQGFDSAVGGGAFLYTGLAKLKLSGVTIDSNTASAVSNQGPVSAEGGGLTMDGSAGTSISDSTISNNHATVSPAGTAAYAYGAGLFVISGGTDTVANSTVANNVATATGTTAAGAVGGGIDSGDHQLVLRYDTVAGNRATASSAGATSSTGGGLNVVSMAELPPELVGTIIAGNRASHGANCAGAVTSEGYNLFGTPTGCQVTFKHSDQEHVAAKLGPLAAHGGPTKTMALKKGSLALNRVPKTTCRKVDRHDQRGVKRPQGAKCDEGAYEKKA